MIEGQTQQQISPSSNQGLKDIMQRPLLISSCIDNGHVWSNPSNSALPLRQVPHQVRQLPHHFYQSTHGTHGFLIPCVQWGYCCASSSFAKLADNYEFHHGLYQTGLSRDEVHGSALVKVPTLNLHQVVFPCCLITQLSHFLTKQDVSFRR